MYPNDPLARLAAHKQVLHDQIALRRLQCAQPASILMSPLIWVDDKLELWKQLPPLVRAATFPIGLFALRMVFPQVKKLQTALRWAPTIGRLASSIHASVTNRRGA